MEIKKLQPVVVSREKITQTYYQEIRRLEPISDYKIERDLIEKAKNGDVEARNTLIKSHLKFVVSVARRTKTSVNLNDLISEGNIGLVKAVENFDTARPERFSTYAVYWIEKQITDYIINFENTVKVKNANKVFTYAEKYRKKFFNEFSRWPNDDELVHYMSDNGVRFSEKQLLSAKTVPIEGGNGEAYDESPAILSPLDFLSSDNNIVEDVEADDNRTIVKTLLAKCTESEANIIRRLYGIGCMEESSSVIADRMGVSECTVRRIARNAIMKMKKHIQKKF